MKAKEFRKKNTNELKIELQNLLCEEFNLRIKNINKKLNKENTLKKVRRNIARIKTLLTEKENL